MDEEAAARRPSGANMVECDLEDFKEDINRIVEGLVKNLQHPDARLEDFFFNQNFYFFEKSAKNEKRYVRSRISPITGSLIELLEAFLDQVKKGVPDEVWRLNSAVSASERERITQYVNAAWQVIYDLIHQHSQTGSEEQGGPCQEYIWFLGCLQNAHKVFINRDMRWPKLSTPLDPKSLPSITAVSSGTTGYCPKVLPRDEGNGPSISKNANFDAAHVKLQELHRSIQSNFVQTIERHIIDSANLQDFTQAKALYNWCGKCISILNGKNYFPDVGQMEKSFVQSATGLNVPISEILELTGLDGYWIDFIRKPSAIFRPDLTWSLEQAEPPMTKVLSMVEFKGPLIHNLLEEAHSGWKVKDEDLFGSIQQQMVLYGVGLMKHDSLFLTDGIYTLMTKINPDALASDIRIDGDTATYTRESIQTTLLINDQLQSPGTLTLQAIILADAFSTLSEYLDQKRSLSKDEFENLLENERKKSKDYRGYFSRPKESQSLPILQQEAGESRQHGTSRKGVPLMELTGNFKWPNSDGLDLLQFGPYYNSQVLKLTIDDCKKIFDQDFTIEGKGPKDYVILKIYNIPFYMDAYEGEVWDVFGSDMFPSCGEFVHHMLRHYKDEVRVYEKIEGSGKELRVPRCYLTGRIELRRNWTHLFEGMYLLMDYIEPDLAKTEKFLKDDTGFHDDRIQSQLRRIVEELGLIGIRYDDLKKENCIITHQGEIYLIDFSHVTILDEDYMSHSKGSHDARD